ncbi:ABC transporter ATP-binding protein [Clostridium estertheticum]|nr:ABC transporter ATP-binding protein [Clostridium estertheticum]
MSGRITIENGYLPQRSTQRIHTITKIKLQWESKSPSEVVNCSSAGDDLTTFKVNLRFVQGLCKVGVIKLIYKDKGGISILKDFVIETNNLTKQYGEQKSVANLSIHVKKGRIYGLLGRNGAGKTTTMKMLLGLTNPTAGEIHIFGKNIHKSEKKILSRIGSLIESPGFYPNLTGTENLKIIARLRGIPTRDAIKNALDVVGLSYMDKKLFSQYSLGMKQRLGIANAIMHDPELLILDEPINGLDPIGIAEVRDFLKRLSTEQGKTILISSHILSEMALLADDIGIIDNGVLLEEKSLAELQQKNSRYIHFIVTDASQASRILEVDFHTSNFHVDDNHNLRLYDTEIEVAAITRKWIENGIDVSEAHTKNDTLEDYFKNVTGGEGIA